MTEAAGRVRLFVDAPLAAGAEVALAPEQAHYLFTVMRLGAGAPLCVFNGRDGAWRAEVAAAGRRGVLAVIAPVEPQRHPPDLWLVFAPLKRGRTDFIVEKATELGTARLVPVFTRRTSAERLRPERLRRIAIEAAEQCGGTHVPEIAPPARLERLIEGWDPARGLLFCDERGGGEPAAAALARAPAGPWAVLVGPEGGFAPEEAERLAALPFVLPVTLGPRILRADTAAIVAIALWQSALGDWREGGR